MVKMGGAGRNKNWSLSGRGVSWNVRRDVERSGRDARAPQQREFFGIGAAVGEDFALPEEFEHGVLADRARLPRSDDRLKVAGSKALKTEVGVQFEKDGVITQAIRPLSRESWTGRSPPRGDAKCLREGF